MGRFETEILTQPQNLKVLMNRPGQWKDWSLRTMREKLVKIGAKVVRHARYVTFQLAEVLVSRSLFCEILERIDRLKPVPIESG